MYSIKFKYRLLSKRQLYEIHNILFVYCIDIKQNRVLKWTVTTADLPTWLRIHLCLYKHSNAEVACPLQLSSLGQFYHALVKPVEYKCILFFWQCKESMIFYSSFCCLRNWLTKELRTKNKKIYTCMSIVLNIFNFHGYPIEKQGGHVKTEKKCNVFLVLHKCSSTYIKCQIGPWQLCILIINIFHSCPKKSLILHKDEVISGL